MAIRNILSTDDPSLKKNSRVVTDFNKRLHTLLDDMRETLVEANGLGLAAPQVGVLRRAVLVVDINMDDEEPDDAVEIEAPMVADGLARAEESGSDEDPEGQDETEGYEEQIIELINPEIVAMSGEQEGSEGCLSLPGVYGLVKRPDLVKVKAQDRYGNPFELWGKKLTARALCHEIDHLNGVIFTSLAERLLSKEEIEQMSAEREQQEEEI